MTLRKILAILFFSLLGYPILNGQEGRLDTIKIGLLITDYSFAPAHDAAELAIKRANDKGGYKGIPFKLVVRSVDGPWGVGSNRTVSLVYEDNAVAIMGSLDGRNAHLVEQVATKSHILFLSTWASDPTLSQAYVPWYFRCLPNDDQQAEILFKMIHSRGAVKVGMFAEENYDARMAARSFVKITGMEGKESPVGCCHRPGLSPELFLEEMEDKKISNILIHGEHEMTAGIVSKLNSWETHQETYTGLRFLSGAGKRMPDLEDYEKLILIAPELWSTAEGIRFLESFRSAWGYEAGLMAAYAFDGMNLILDAIMEAGPDRESIRDHLITVDYSGGVTGRIRFDEMGNLMDMPHLMKIQEGQLVPIRNIKISD